MCYASLYSLLRIAFTLYNYELLVVRFISIQGGHLSWNIHSRFRVFIQHLRYAKLFFVFVFY